MVFVADNILMINSRLKRLLNNFVCLGFGMYVFNIYLEILKQTTASVF